jgi:hypothetical protein
MLQLVLCVSSRVLEVVQEEAPSGKISASQTMMNGVVMAAAYSRVAKERLLVSQGLMMRKTTKLIKCFLK